MHEIPKSTINQIINDLLNVSPNEQILSINKKKISRRQLYFLVQLYKKNLTILGLKKNNSLLALIDNSLEQIVLVLSCLSLGIIWIPLGNERKGVGLHYIINLTNPKFIITKNGNNKFVPKIYKHKILNLSNIKSKKKRKNTNYILAKNPKCILFTSGTTGPPKGVIVNEKMLITSAYSTGLACNVNSTDKFLLWESLHHIGGLEILFLCLIKKIRMVVIKKFSASEFWKQINEHKITKLHYLGGILDILIKQKPSKFDKKHSIKLGFGAGARNETYKMFKKRFNIPLREVYGMTEASSFTTINFKNIKNSIGQSLPWFKLKLINEHKNTGEIAIKELSKDIITQGYYKDRKATSGSFRNGWFYTGDIARKDKYGNFYFVGRKKDSIRVKGENIAAWEIESNIVLHKDISEVAVLGTKAKIGEEDMIALIIKKKKENLSIKNLSKYFIKKMNKNHIPRYWALVNSFPRTTTLRIDKKNIKLSGTRVYDNYKDKFIYKKD